MSMQQLSVSTPFSNAGDVPVGFVLSHEQFPVPQLLELGIAAEEAGFNAAWGSDHFQPWQANQGHAGFTWATLAALTQRTRRIALGTGITCPTYRYEPAIVAQGFSTLSLLAPGRIFLGTGTGEAVNELASGGGWGPYKERAARLIEAIDLMRKLWTGEAVSYRGEYYSTDKAKLYDPPAQPVPIYMAAAGRNSMKAAGQYADGLITDGKSLQTAELRAAFEEGAKDEGRRPAGKETRQMPIVIEHWALFGDEAEAKQLAELWRFNPKAWEKYVHNPDPADIERQARKDVPIEEAYKEWAIGRDPQVHIQKIRSLLDAGATQIFVHSAQPDQKAFIDFYGREVLPRL